MYNSKEIVTHHVGVVEIKVWTKPCSYFTLSSMPRHAKPIPLTVRGQNFTFPEQTLGGYPSLAVARAFLEHLLDRGRVTAGTASHYVKLVGRLLRNGKIIEPPNPVAQTAASAYHAWLADAYAERVRPVVVALGAGLHSRGAITWLRRGSLVPPFEGKQIPKVTIDPTAWDRMKAGDANASPTIVTWTPSIAWTLHVPPNVQTLTLMHADPCATCAAIELDATQLETIAVAFEKAWGHRELNAVPNEALLFGDSPPEYTGDTQTPAVAIGRVLALVDPGPLADALRKLGAVVVLDADAYAKCVVDEPPDTVVISRKTCGSDYDKTLSAVHESWCDHVVALDGGAHDREVDPPPVA